MTARWAMGRGLWSALGTLVVCTFTRSATADSSAPVLPSAAFAAPAAPPSAASPPTPEELEAQLPKVLWRPWRLFDPYLSRREIYVTGGPVTEQAFPGGNARSGFALAIGQSIESRVGALLLRGQADYGFHYTGSDHFVLSLPNFNYGAGLVLGPVEVTVRAGVATAEVHFGVGGFGLGFLSPRADIGAAVTVGPCRVGVRLFTEYSWRWTSGPSTRLDGLLIEVALGRVKGLPPRRYLAPTAHSLSEP